MGSRAKGFLSRKRPGRHKAHRVDHDRTYGTGDKHPGPHFSNPKGAGEVERRIGYQRLPGCNTTLASTNDGESLKLPSMACTDIITPESVLAAKASRVMSSASCLRSGQSSQYTMGQALTLVEQLLFDFQTLKRAVHRKGRVGVRSG